MRPKPLFLANTALVFRGDYETMATGKKTGPMVFFAPRVCNGGALVDELRGAGRDAARGWPARVPAGVEHHAPPLQQTGAEQRLNLSYMNDSLP